MLGSHPVSVLDQQQSRRGRRLERPRSDRPHRARRWGAGRHRDLHRYACRAESHRSDRHPGDRHVPVHLPSRASRSAPDDLHHPAQPDAARGGHAPSDNALRRGRLQRWHKPDPAIQQQRGDLVVVRYERAAGCTRRNRRGDGNAHEPDGDHHGHLGLGVEHRRYQRAEPVVHERSVGRHVCDRCVTHDRLIAPCFWSSCGVRSSRPYESPEPEPQ